MPKLQAASALGQARLQQAWERALAREGLLAAQVLLTASDVADRAAYVNARNALHALFALGAVPIVNENDTTATDEIAFGDNDALAAQVAILVRARLLVLLTEVDGVFTRAPGTPGAELVGEGVGARSAVARRRVARSDAAGCGARCSPPRMAAAAGIPTVIAGGAGEAVLEPILAGEPRGTRFHGVGPGAVRVQALAPLRKAGRAGRSRSTRARAVRSRSTARSLLAVGVVSCEGRFEAGDAVELVGPDGVAFAKGIAGADAGEIAARRRGSRRCTETVSSCTEAAA